MILDQGVLRPMKPIGKQVAARPQQRKEGISVNRIERLMQTGKPYICIIRSLGGIGDVLMTTPFVRALKHKWPNSHITYATDFKYMDGALRDILLYNSNIDELLQYQVASSKEYDYKVDVTSVCVGMEQPGTNVANRIDLFAQHVGISLEESGYVPDYIVSDEEAKWAKEKLERYPRRAPNAPRIGIQVRSSSVSRSWALGKVRDLAVRLINELGAQVVVFDSSHGGGPQEQWNIAGIVAIKDYKIRQVAALINEMDLMVTPDSGLMHIAGALNKRIVSLWAGTDPKARINHYPNAVAIARKNYTCFPCWYRPVACNKSYLCMKSITVDEVFQKIVEHLDTKIISLEDVASGTYRITHNYTDDGIQRDRRILINRCSGFGDVLMCTSIAKTLKQRYPELHITFRTNQVDLLQGIPEIDEVIYGAFETPLSNIDNSYGHIIDLNFAVESTNVSGSRGKATEDEYMSVPRIELFYRQAGVQMDEFPGLGYHVFDEEKDRAEEILKDLKHPKTIVYVINSMSPYRTYHAQGTVEVIKDLCKDYNVIGIGNMDEIWGEKHRFCRVFHEHLDKLDTYHHLTSLPLRDKIALLSLSDLVITPDTGMLHAAAAVDVPTIGLFGNIHPYLRCSFYPNVYSLFEEQSCFSECGDRIGFLSHRCPSYVEIESNKTGMIGARCMRAIKPKQIINLARELLNEES